MRDPLHVQTNCIFCQIISGEKSGFLIDENEHIAVFLSLEGHPLIVPKLHVKDIFELNEEQAGAIMQSAVCISKATKAATSCDGINLVQSNGSAAGQDVFHFHLHIKPRFLGDRVTMKWDTANVNDALRAKTAARIKDRILRF